METLIIVEGVFREARFPLVSQQMTIGRHASCEIRLSDASVSQSHARVDKTEAGVTLVDLGSLNGTFVNDARLRGPKVLKNRDIVRVGGVKLRYLSESTEVQVAFPELARRNRSRIEALSQFQTQVSRVHSWETVTTLLCQTVSRLLGPRFRIQGVVFAPGADFMPYGRGEATMYPLPPKARIDEALAAGEPVWVDTNELLVPFDASTDTPVRALHVAGPTITDADVEMLRFAIRVASQTPAFREGGAGESTMVLKPGVLDGIVGKSAALRRVVDEITLAAPTSAPVLILGESGTGKELVARAIHQLGTQSEEPFVPVNCAALAPELIDSELFGHEKGAFTGANARHLGLFEQAGSGTLFLDEVGELPSAAQAKLLRTLDTGEYRRVGGKRLRQAGARILCATNRDLEQEMEANNFRVDLYYRVAGFVIRVPPLRERREDIEPLVHHFFVRHAGEARTPVPELDEGVMDRLRGYDWPGNVRELDMVVRRLVHAGGGKPIGIHDLSLPGGGKVQGGALLSLRELERRHIREVLEACGGNKTRAAEALGISRMTLYDKLRSYSKKR